MSIQHQSHLFALTDYGFMGPIGTVVEGGVVRNKNILSDFSRISLVMANWLQDDHEEISKLLEMIGEVAADAAMATPIRDPFGFIIDGLIDVMVQAGVLDIWHEVVQFGPKASRVTARFDLRQA